MAKLIEITGKAISGEWGNDDESGTGIPVLRTTNFTNSGIIDYSKVVTRDIKKKNLESKYLRYGDIIIEKSGGSDTQPVGRVVFFEGEENKYLFNNFTGLLRVADHSVCFSKYLFYFLYYNYQRGGTIPFQNKTTGLHNLKTDDYVSRCEVPLPPLETQKQIAANLDKATQTIDLCNVILEKLDLLVKARFVEMFGEIGSESKWEIKKLGDCCQVNPKKQSDSRLISGLKVSFVPMPAVSEKGEIDASETRIYDDVKTGFTYFAENDVLFAKITPCMENGKGAVAVGLTNKIGFGSTEFHVLRPIDKISNSQWLYAITSFQQFRKDAEANMTGSAGQKRVPAKFLENYLIALPPLELQDEFAAFVEKTDRTKAAVKQVLAKAENLKKALMQEYFG